MFYDSSRHTVDAKNRVFVPKRFQQALGRDPEGHVIAFLTLGFEGCLFLFSESGIAEVRSRLDSFAFSGREMRNKQRMFFSKTQRVQLDASGRLLLPEKLKVRIGIEREVVMVGVDDRAEVWPVKAWEALEAEHDADYDELDSVLCRDPLGDRESQG